MVCCIRIVRQRAALTDGSRRDRAVRAVRAEDLPFSTGLSQTLLAAMDSLGLEPPAPPPSLIQSAGSAGGDKG